MVWLIAMPAPAPPGVAEGPLHAPDWQRWGGVPGPHPAGADAGRTGAAHLQRVEPVPGPPEPQAPRPAPHGAQSGPQWHAGHQLRQVGGQLTHRVETVVISHYQALTCTSSPFHSSFFSSSFLNFCISCTGISFRKGIFKFQYLVHQLMCVCVNMCGCVRLRPN